MIAIEAITIGPYILEWTEAGILFIHNTQSGESMQADEDNLAEAIRIFWDQEF